MSVTLPFKGTGDAISQLIQLACKNLKVDVRVSGRGHEDIQSLVMALKNTKMARDELWSALGTIIDHPTVQSAMQADESFHAVICANILRAKACIDLQNVQRVETPQASAAAPLVPA